MCDMFVTSRVCHVYAVVRVPLDRVLTRTLPKSIPKSLLDRLYTSLTARRYFVTTLTLLTSL